MYYKILFQELIKASEAGENIMENSCNDTINVDFMYRFEMWVILMI